MHTKFRTFLFLSLVTSLYGCGGSHGHSGNGSSDTITVRSIALNTKNLVFDSKRNLIWASVFPTGSTGDSVVAINPKSGAVVTTINVGADPDRLAISDDGSTMFVGRDASGTIRVVDLATNTAGAEFPVTQPASGTYHAADIAVAPGSNSTIAITTDFEFSGGSGPEIYDNGVPRPNRLGLYEGNRLFWTSPNRIVAFEPLATGQPLFDVAVDAQGATKSRQVSDVFALPAANATRYGGRLFGSDGSVIDENTLALVGTVTPPPPTQVYDNQNLGPVVDAARNRIYYVSISQNLSVINAYRLDTLQRTGHRQLLNVEGIGVNRAAQYATLVSAGNGRLAFSTAERVCFIDNLSGL